MVTEADVRLADGRILHAYDTAADGTASGRKTPGPAVAVFWLHGGLRSRRQLNRVTAPPYAG